MIIIFLYLRYKKSPAVEIRLQQEIFILSVFSENSAQDAELLSRLDAISSPSAETALQAVSKHLPDKTALYLQRHSLLW